MSNCTKCKAELPEGARFCNKCGTPQIPAQANNELPPKTTPLETPIVNPKRTIQPGIKHTPQQQADSHKTPNSAPVTTSKELPAREDVNDAPHKLESLTLPNPPQAAPGSKTQTDKDNKPEIVVFTPTQTAQEP